MGNTISVKKQDDNGIVEVRNNFNARLRKINESFGNREVYDDLIKLRNNILKRFDNAEGRELAFQVQCTARSLLPSENDLWEKLPADIQRLIFSKANNSEKTVTSITTKQLLISKQLTSGLLLLRNGWINKEFISPKLFGCMNSKQALEFIIDNELNVANLLEYPDFGDDNDLDKLSQCRPQLRKLSIKSKNLSSYGVTVFEKFKSLQHLDYTSYHYVEDVLKAIQKLPLLENLSFTGCWWHSDLEGIENLSLLQYLKLQTVNVGVSENEMDKSLEALKKLTKLKSLEFIGNLAFSGDKLAEVIEKNPLLQSLTVSDDGHFRIKGDKIVEAIEKLTRLHSLNLSGCFKLPEKIAESIGKFTLLKNLNLNGCRQLSDKLVMMLEKLPLLQSLDISHCGYLSVAGLSDAIGELNQLTSLDLGGGCNGGSTQLVSMLGKLPLLRSLGLWNAPISDEELVEIIEKLPLLEILDVGACFFTGDKLVTIELPSLKSLNLSGCNQISNDNLVKIVEKLPKLECLIAPWEREAGYIGNDQNPYHYKGNQKTILENVKEFIAKKSTTQ